MNKIISINRGILLSIIIWLLFLAISNFIAPSYLNTDTANGFITMHNFNTYSNFNKYCIPNIDNIQYTIVGNQTWWSPGQWFVPWLLLKFNITLGMAISIIITIFSFIGLMGYYKLFKLFQFDEKVVNISLLIICSSIFFITPFEIYNGGEILQFGWIPWLIILCIKYDKKTDGYFNLKNIIIITLCLVVGFFLKSSSLLFICIFLISYRYIPFSNFSNKNHIGIVYLIISILLGYSICRITFLRHGPNPMAFWYNQLGDGLTINKIKSIIFVISGPITSTIGFDVYLSKMQLPVIGEIIMYLIFFVLFVALSIYSFIHKKRMLIFILCYIFILFYLFCYLTGKVVSCDFESRHFRLVGLLLIPVIVEFVYHTFDKRVSLYIFLSLISLLTTYSVIVHLKNCFGNQIIVSNNWGFRHRYVDNEVLSYVSKNKNQDILWYFPCSEMSLEVPVGKAIVFDDNNNQLSSIQQRIIKGRTNKLCMVIPNNFIENGKMIAIINSFKDYKPNELNYQKLDKYTIVKYGM